MFSTSSGGSNPTLSANLSLLKSVTYIDELRRVREHVVVSSQSLLDELGGVLERKFRQRAADVQTARRLFAETLTLVEPAALDVPVCRDRDDDVVLATAPAGACVAIVTIDQDLLILDPFRGIRVITPSAFWQWEPAHDVG